MRERVSSEETKTKREEGTRKDEWARRERRKAEGEEKMIDFYYICPKNTHSLKDEFYFRLGIRNMNGWERNIPCIVECVCERGRNSSSSWAADKLTGKRTFYFDFHTFIDIKLTYLLSSLLCVAFLPDTPSRLPFTFFLFPLLPML